MSATAYPILDPCSKLWRAPEGRCALAVMAKAPRAGAVKTRLQPQLTPDEAAALSVCFLRDTTANLASVAAATGGADAVVAYTPVGAESAFKGLLPPGCKLVPQRGDDFGDRLFYAAQDLLAVGYESLCLINSDSPTLPPAALAAAVSALSRAGDRLVLGPADDGGYYLIGIKRAHRRLFDDIDWSTPRVLAQTLERAAEIGLEVELLPAWYDVDDADTLRRLCNEFFPPDGNGAPLHDDNLGTYNAPHTRNYLAKMMRDKPGAIYD